MWRWGKQWFWKNRGSQTGAHQVVLNCCIVARFWSRDRRRVQLLSALAAMRVSRLVRCVTWRARACCVLFVASMVCVCQTASFVMNCQKNNNFAYINNPSIIFFSSSLSAPRRPPNKCVCVCVCLYGFHSLMMILNIFQELTFGEFWIPIKPEPIKSQAPLLLQMWRWSGAAF